MKISGLDEKKRDLFHIGDFVSEKVEGGYKLKIFVSTDESGNKIFHYEEGKIFNGDEELGIVPYGDGFAFALKNGEAT